MAARKNGHGGARRGSGRKSNAEIARARELMGQALGDADWIEIFIGLAKNAKKGDAVCASLLMKYQFGLPTQLLGGDDDAAAITTVEYLTAVRTARKR